MWKFGEILPGEGEGSDGKAPSKVGASARTPPRDTLTFLSHVTSQKLTPQVEGSKEV